MNETMIARLASALDAAHRSTMATIMATVPHGSGIDGAVALDEERSNRARIVIHADVHLMDENGYYIGWRTATVTIRPTFAGIDVDVTGKGVDDGWKDYLADCFRDWAQQPDNVTARQAVQP